jgi:hypothetical protein
MAFIKHNDDFDYIPIENPCYVCGQENTLDHRCSDESVQAFYESELILLNAIVERLKQRSK